jgi:hypothetical protein
MHEPSQTPYLRDMVWFIPACIATCFGGIALLAQGAKGAEVSQTLSFVVAILALLLALLFRTREPQPPLRRGRFWLTLLVAVALGLGSASTWWFVIHSPDLRITDDVTVLDGQSMEDGSQATVEIPGRPPGRENLSITFTLANARSTGNCVVPATLEVRLLADDRWSNPPAIAHSGEEIRLPLSRVKDRAGVQVDLRVPDGSCLLHLKVSEAVLYN